jgi:predicted  nucleic acid-binding Zn-ribbon protein
MELTATHAIQGVLLLATVVGGYAVVKSNLARVMEDLEIFHKNFDKFKSDFDARLDDAESQRAVFNSQIDVLKEINSVSALRDQNREMATVQAELKVLRQMTDHLMHIHNSKHPKTDA